MGALGTAVFGEETFAGYPFVPAATPFPLLLVEEAFPTPPLAESPAFVDLGQENMRSFSVTHNGRSSELDSPSAGGASSVMDVTEDRALDPTNSSSPYAPNVKPNRRWRLRMVHDGVTWPICETFVNGHAMQYAIDNYDEALCALDTTDGFKILERASLAGMAPRPKERADLRLLAILDHVGWPLSRRAISVARTILSPEDISNRSALTALRQIDDTECGRLRIDQAGRLVFLSRRDIGSAERQTVSQATFSDSGAEGTIPYKSIQIDQSETLIRNIVRITHPTEPEIVVSDAASILEHGPIEYTREVRDATAAARRATAEHFLAAYKDPIVRCLGVTVLTSDTPPGFPTGLFGKVASLQVGYRVTVERLLAPGGSGSGGGFGGGFGGDFGEDDAFVGECFIEAKSDAAQQGELKWFTGFSFSTAPPVVLGSKWGSGQWGSAKWGW